MINPAWLSGAYIVENSAINYDDNSDIGILSSNPTSISAIRYRQFVSEYPDRVSYYQPVLDRLGYAHPDVVPIHLVGSKPSAVIVEGISDYHALCAICREDIAATTFELMPGLGAGASGPLVSLMIARGTPFIILLDDDPAGRNAVKQYRSKFFLSDTSVLTLRDLDSKLKGKTLESLLSADTQKIICKHFGKKGAVASKQEIGVYFSEKNYGKTDKSDVSRETADLLFKIVDQLDARLRGAS
jgi:hypothetical protein